MNISAPFIRRPVATSLLMIAIALLGLAAWPLLPVAPLPQVDFPTISVSASLPGASPETMASAVAQPLERQFGQIAGVTQSTSTSTLGSTSITLQFELNRNIDAAAQDVQAAITAAARQLPTDLPSPPTYRKVNPADSPILVMGVHSDSLPLTAVDDYADTILAQQISQISGVAQVSIGGEQKPSVRVQIDPAKLATKGLTLEDIRGVLASATTNAAKGTLNGATRSFTIAANDQLAKASDYDDVIIAYRNGAAVRVKDVGHAVDGPENLYTQAWDNNKPAVLLVVIKQPGANVIETVDLIKQALPRLQAVIPPAVTVDILSDRTATIRASVEDVEFTLGHYHRPRGARDPALPAQSSRHRHTEPGRAALAARRRRGHVSRRVQPRQSVADGAHHLGRLRRRRCHRGGGEHLSPHRGRHGAARGGADRLARDRLHRIVDQSVACRGVHSALADGRDHRAAVPRIRHHRHRGHRRLGLRVADADADALRALPPPRQRAATAASTMPSRPCSTACTPSTGAPSTSCSGTSC